ncbi:MAG TPA: methyltransferase domain-containing protein [Kofleriaceae bacterium]|nr:methyltransferase domain-containing protein [Kofleriaceae bacterium]
MKFWLLDVLACPAAGCGGRLVAARSGLLACRRCATLYPVLGDAPVMVPAPAEYLAGYRDAAVATLATHGRATRAQVELIDAFAGAVARTEPLAFGDDWVGREDAPPPPPAGADPAAAAFAGFLAAVRGVDDAIVRLLGDRPGTTVEVGCGAGVLARALARRAPRLLVTDLSLRAVLRAAAGAAPRRARAADVAGAVVDAEALPLQPRSVDTVVAAELIDLLAAPDAFLAGAAAALRPGGRLVVATPDPSLGTGDDDALRARLRHGGWTVAAEERGIAWVRPHGPRHYQVYFADVVVATPAATSSISGRDRSRGRARGRARPRGRRSPS